MAVLWAVLLGAFIKYVITEGLTRWQLATGQTLLEGAIHRLGKPAQYFFISYFVVWTFGVGSSLMSACGVAAHALFPVFEDPETGKIVFGLLHSMLGLGLVLVGSYRMFSGIMSVCVGVMFILVVVTALPAACGLDGGVARDGGTVYSRVRAERHGPGCGVDTGPDGGCRGDVNDSQLRLLDTRGRA